MDLSPNKRRIPYTRPRKRRTGAPVRDMGHPERSIRHIPLTFQLELFRTKDGTVRLVTWIKIQGGYWVPTNGLYAGDLPVKAKLRR
jgi:hypothetical protein